MHVVVAGLAALPSAALGHLCNRGGWALPLFLLDDEAQTFVAEVYHRADAFLVGRRTYELFAGSRGVITDPGNPLASALNTRPNDVASATLTDPQWANTTSLSGDVVAAVGELKVKRGGGLQVHGSGNLVRWLLGNQLVDEITRLAYPVIVGQGTRLFPDTGADVALNLVESRSTPTGVTIQVYRPPAVCNGHADLKHGDGQHSGDERKSEHRARA